MTSRRTPSGRAVSPATASSRVSRPLIGAMRPTYRRRPAGKAEGSPRGRASAWPKQLGVHTARDGRDAAAPGPVLTDELGALHLVGRHEQVGHAHDAPFLAQSHLGLALAREA